MIKDLKELEKLLKLCRKQGVSGLNLGDLSITFGEMPKKESEAIETEVDPEDPYANFPAGTLTPDQLMFYSSGGAPENDPELNQ